MSSSVKSAERALDVLHLLASRTRPVPTMSIAQQVGMPKSSTYHLLNVMHDRGWLIYYERDHSWSLSAIALDLASGYLQSAPLQQLGRPLLASLAADTGFAAHLALLHGVEVLYLGKAQPAEAGLQLVTKPGIRLPAHLAAVGMAILSALDDSQVKALYGHRPLVSLNGSGPADLPQLFRELHETRDRGYSYERGRITRGVSCLGVSVLSAEGRPVASIGVTWAEAPSIDSERPEIAARVHAAAIELQRQLSPRRQPVAPLKAVA